MKKIIVALAATSLIASSIYSVTHVNKTFLLPRSVSDNLATQFSTWHDQTKRKDENKWNGTMQVVPFFQKSDNKKDLGKLFGITNRSVNNRIDDYMEISDTADDSHFYTNDIIHFWMDSDSANMFDKITLRPDQKSFGVHVSYYQNLDILFKGLFFKVDMPIAHVKTSLNYTHSGTPTKQALATDADWLASGKGNESLYIDPNDCTGREVLFEDYLTGKVKNSAIHAKQEKLSHYKIHNGKSQTEIADVTITGGYNFIYKENMHVNANFCYLFPMGNKPTGEYRFEPVVGNGRHKAWGLGLDSSFELWNEEDRVFELSIVVNYKNFSLADETRTLDYKYADTPAFYNSDLRATWGPYILGGRSGDTFTTPLANFLTTDVEVNPGHQLNAMAAFSFHFDNWTFDFGYETFVKTGEKLTVKTWTDDVYGQAAWGWDTVIPFLTGTTVDYDTIWRGILEDYAYSGYDLTAFTIDKEHLLVDDASSPSQFSHKIFAALGHACNDWRYPLIVGFGGSYEFAANNATLEGFALWCKFGMTF
jgi:hypothetical protein